MNSIPISLAAAQVFKISAGLGQVAFALWLMVRGPRTRVNVAFAVAFAANGVAYAIFNLALPGSRTPDSVVVQGRGLFNWIAVVAIILFAVFFAQTVRHRASSWLIALGIALMILLSDVIEARERGLGLLAFGGTAVYPATAFALALFPLLFARNSELDVRTRCAWFAAAFSVNSVDHLGAGVIQPGPLSSGHAVVQIGAMSIILVLWLWNARRSSVAQLSLPLAVVFWMIAPFVAGVFVRIALGSYRGVQEVGFVGAGRLVATGLLVYGMRVRGLFSCHQEGNFHATFVR